MELPTYQLEQRIKEELEQNPLLEEVEEKGETDVNEETATDSGEEFDDDYQEGESEEENDLRGDDDFSLEDYMTDDDDTPDYRLNSSNASKDEETRDFVFSQASSFRESLIAQLGTRPLSDLERRITEYIIGNIDEDGYLRRDIENIVDDLAFGAGIEVSEEEVLRLLKIIQEFEPAGVGARDLKECLLLQIQHKLNENPEHKLLQDAKAILEECFEEFSRKHIPETTIERYRTETGHRRNFEIESQARGDSRRFFLRTTGRKDYSGFYARFGRWRIAAEFKFRGYSRIENQ